ncbi:MAG: ABC transporter substrate-binding protein [Spirochaetales bacterium]|uniref:ABC transporter substrate-binding protein n=1 Tax=Candidatus Thalassospirochaeta sargassi TaxID=3119039 RepID=A0AAJ1IAL3_9SPIO|nr:ABC transporter substrate-binding protein [Spirochaetales bacterium]
MKNRYFAVLMVLLVISSAAFISGCSKEEAAQETAAEEVKEAAVEPVKIGISKIVAHPALDALEQGIVEVVSEKYPDAVFDLQNANGEMTTASSIAQKFKSEKVDVAVGIATPTAQALAQAITDTPVMFSAVTDPVDAGLVTSTAMGEGNVTGVSDMTPVKEQIELLASLIDLKTLGHVYTNSEANAVRLAEITEEVCGELGITFIGTGVSNSAEVKQAAQAIAGKIDAFYVSTDNTVVSAISAMVDVAEKAGIPIVSADPTSSEPGGVLLSWGFDYYKMGKASGRMVLQLLEGADPASLPTMFMTDPSDIDLLIDTENAKALGIDIPADLLAAARTVQY